MKKLAVIALALVTLSGFAQKKGEKKMDRENRSELMKDMTPNDIADLKSKTLTLKLDLSDAQQKEVHKLIVEQAEKRAAIREERKASKDEERKRPSKEERIKMQNERLDEQIEMKRQMKSILNEEQYAEFEKMKPQRQEKKRKA
ncbi:hypothetical protein [Winogradskyella vidalii]|uniref:hypothetical protein n=1 Tax=Winogradskyella vidalii TaxID=2615024 RepID=UPI0015CD6E52|nr:hypothetical protein [Winogradskyella vidalii]